MSNTNLSTTGKPDVDHKGNSSRLTKPDFENPNNPGSLENKLSHDPHAPPKESALINNFISSIPLKQNNSENAVVIVIPPPDKDSLLRNNCPTPIESVPQNNCDSNIIEPNQQENIDKESAIITCPICYGEYETTLSRKLSCQHIFCKDCLELYIKTKIAGFEPASIKCPQSGCTSFIGQETIESLLDANSLEQYKKLIEIKNRFRNNQAKFCPQPGCARELKINSGQEFTQCACGALICNQCFQIKHNGRSCAEILKDSDELYSKNQNVKMCIICKTKVEKTVGCSKVQCLVCDYVWCWDCGRESEPGHMMRCTKIWSPKPPQSASPKENIFGRICSAFLRVLGMIFFYLLMLIGCLLAWPFIGYSVITDNKPGTSCIKILLAFVASLLVWPLVVVIGPLAATVDEYASFFTGKKRWLNGGVKSFGMINNQNKAQVNISPEENINITTNHHKQEEKEVKEDLQNDVRIDIS